MLKKNLYYKLLFLFLFLSFGLMISISSYFVAQKYQLSELNDEMKVRAHEAISLKTNALFGYIKDRERLVQTLNSNMLRRHLNDSSNEKFLVDLNNLFLSHAKSRKDVFQLRYIDENGDEITRVDRDSYASEAYLVQKNKLQNKKKQILF